MKGSLSVHCKDLGEYNVNFGLLITMLSFFVPLSLFLLRFPLIAKVSQSGGEL